MVFEKVLQDDGYFVLKTPNDRCLTINLHWVWLYYSYLPLDCTPNKDNLWKYSVGRVYNKDGRALWWDGENSNTFFLNKISEYILRICLFY